MSSGQGRHSGSADDWKWSDEELIGCYNELRAEVTLDTKHDVPYGAGYSVDADTIYIDRNIPHYLEVKAKSGKGTVKLDIWKCFAFHEMTEKSLEDEPYNLEYQKAHQCALRLEKALVNALGADWDDYYEQTSKEIEAIYKAKVFKNVPKDLDLEPYKDEKDWDCLKRMGRENEVEE